MMLKGKVVSLLLSIFSLNVCLCCEINYESSFMKCTSIQQLTQLKSKQNSKIVYIGGENKQELSTIYSTTFKNIPSVETLILHGVVNKIAPGSFDELTKLKKLILENNTISSINADILRNINIHSLVIDNCEVNEIKPGLFDNLKELKQVRIDNNHILTINTNVFTNTKVESIILTGNKIQFIENRAFGSMPNLKKLQLNNNELTSFDTKLLLESNPSLELLDLSNNLLKSLSTDMFKEIENLQELRLSHNKIDTLAKNCLHSFKKITKIDLSNNNIREIPPEIFPDEGLQTLRVLYLHENQLCYLSPQVLYQISNVKSLSYGGNPWQCPCWEVLDKWISQNNILRICHQEYASGQRPECIFTEFTECVLDKDKLNHIPQMFLNETAVYPKVTTCA